MDWVLDLNWVPPDVQNFYCFLLNAWYFDTMKAIVTVNSELLEALRNLLPHAEKLFQASHGIDGLVTSRSGCEYDIEQARIAIANAEGIKND